MTALARQGPGSVDLRVERRPVVPSAGESRATVLVIDDEPDMRDMLAFELSREGFEVVVADGGAAATAVLKARRCDLAITDLRMPGMNGVETLAALKTIDPEIEVIVATGYATVGTAVECMKLGAYDYIQKPYDLRQLRLTLEHALERRALSHSASLHEAGRVLSTTLDSRELIELVLRVARTTLAADGAALLLEAGDEAERGYHAHPGTNVSVEVARRLAEEVRGRTEPHAVDLVSDCTDEALREGGPHSALVVPIPMRLGKGGTLLLFRSGSGRPFAAPEARRGEILSSYAALALQNAMLHGALQRDVAKRRRAEETARVRTQQLTQAQALAHLGSWEWDVRADAITWSDEVYRIFGLVPGRVPLTYDDAFERVHSEDRSAVEAAMTAALSGEPFNFYHRIVQPDGAIRTLHARGELLADGARVRGTIQDVTELRQARDALQVAEERLRQAHKMEAIGRLSGGIAHDFNNLLTAIIGHGELVLERLGPGDPHRKGIKAILGAGRRAASLTKQLLAFSRQQVLQPRVMDLNVVVSQMEDLLRRLIGENIQLDLVLTPNIWNVRVDPTQLEQVVMNLAVNARDAMPDGGRLTIETANADLCEALVRRQISGEGGPHVRLTVRDSGCGMRKETLIRIFEPFFTTKELGRGTGLGLATVHGIVKQSCGHIYVESQPGAGTSFEVYLPRVDDALTRAESLRSPDVRPGGEEIVLVVEDEDAVREVVCDALRACGYAVLAAGSAEEALELLRSRAGDVHLLLTDVVMANMGGPELARRVRMTRPGVRILYMSGYDAAGTIRRDRARSSPVPFLEKPFTLDVFTRKVREVLDESPVPSPAAGDSDDETRPLVLVIDDNADNLQYTQQVLEGSYDVQVAGSGSSAFGLVRGGGRHPDLVVLDIAMPRRDGFGVLTDLRGDPATARIPILACTAHSMRGDRERALAAGFDGYLTKPFRSRDLLALVVSFVGPGEPKKTADD